MLGVCTSVSMPIKSTLENTNIQFITILSNTIQALKSKWLSLEKPENENEYDRFNYGKNQNVWSGIESKLHLFIFINEIKKCKYYNMYIIHFIQAHFCQISSLLDLYSGWLNSFNAECGNSDGN